MLGLKSNRSKYQPPPSKIAAEVEAWAADGLIPPYSSASFITDVVADCLKAVRERLLEDEPSRT